MLTPAYDISIVKWVTNEGIFKLSVTVTLKLKTGV